MKGFLTKVLHNIEDPVFVKDENHIYLTANKAFCDWLGIDVETIVGKSDHDIFLNKEEADFFVAKDKEIFDSGENQEIEEIVTKHSGETLVCRTKKSMFIDEDGGKVLVGIIRDIDKLKKTEELLKDKTVEAEAANRAKSLFLANMSHEIRTPLNAILGFTDLLVEDPKRKDKEELLKGLQYSGKSLFTLLDNILDISKIEAGKDILRESTFSLHELVNEVEQQFLPLVKEKGLAWSLNMAITGDGYMQSDAAKIKQILINLLSNAIKFTNEGGITLSASKRNERLIFEITDTGIGVSKGFRENLFDVFSRDLEFEKIEGAGLGLSITKKIIELFKGQIYYTPNTPQGSVFCFELPFVQGDVADIKSPLEKRTQKELHILVGEDNAMNQLLIGKMLDYLGHKHLIVGDGLQVVKELSRTKYDLVLLDIRMPVLDGYSTAKIMSDSPELCKIPIIALTANTLKEDINRIEKQGMKFIAKPIEVEKLAQGIEEVMTRNID